MRSHARLIVVVISALGPVSCGDSGPAFVAWPDLDEGTLSFVIAFGRDGAPTSHGPFGPDGPMERLTSPARAEVFVVTLRTESLEALHPRVDGSRLSELQLVPEPVGCSQCSKTCRQANDEILFHPIPTDAATLVLGEDGLEPFDGPLETGLWLQLPAVWDCVDLLPDGTARRIESWPRLSPRGLARLQDDRLLVLGANVRFVGTSTPGFSEDTEGWAVVEAASLNNERAVALRFNYAAGAPSWVLTFDVTGPVPRLVGSVELGFHAPDMYTDELGVVVAGELGSIATSTDGRTFERSRLDIAAELDSVDRVPGARPEYFLGAPFGFVAAGDPWDSSTPWTLETVLAGSDETVRGFVGLRSQSRPELNRVWTRLGTDGLHERAWASGEWTEPQLEAPRDGSACSRGIDECGFSRLSRTVPFPVEANERVFLTIRNCPLLLEARPARVCLSSVEILAEDGPYTGSKSEAVIVEDDAFISVEDGIISVPLDGL